MERYLIGLWIIVIIMGIRMRDYRRKELEQIEPKEHPLYKMYPMLLFILDKSRIGKKSLHQKRRKQFYYYILVRMKDRPVWSID